ncbi:uncharacterized protein BDR25DRAFT_285575 [Lindgomyces ingoldianus]|uniref:Uncharacterized protein n=1 Tax=Lindgomyces ingoldianus TaxID=673940 RepID=A0ACB6QX47_9PLEO|nr:uncharacterized protein BDR25DRAFT_285575 [Lindgomyces ingoldianus]KAF2471143.1 hypothetical protein BDR25DRAFT_285575 [Lindgomyces ingoldianus]
MAFPQQRLFSALSSYTRQFSTSNLRYQPQSNSLPPKIPYTPTCPSPTCPCTSPPTDLDIDVKSPLLNTMASYSSHVVICSGKADWTSRIEDEVGEGGDFVRGLKAEIGKGGRSFDPFTNTLTTLSSLPPSSSTTTAPTTSVLLFPQFLSFPSIPHSQHSISALATAFLKARTLHPLHTLLSPTQKAALTRNPSLASVLPAPNPITTPTILICSHGSRDSRCGILGPILHDEFRRQLESKGVSATVGVISHIGGHKFAGNVIIYLPPASAASPNNSGNKLAGSGVWYGRVGPENVEGIIEETILRGRVIGELLRGGITGDGGSLGRLVEEQVKRDEGGKGSLWERLRLRPRSRA